MRFIKNVDCKQMLAVDQLLFSCLLLAFFTMPSGISPPTIFVIIALAIWLFSGRCIRFCRDALKLSWIWPVLFFVLLTWVGMTYSSDTFGIGLGLAKKTHYYLYSMVIASVAFKKFTVEKLLQAFLWGLAINAIVGISQAIGLVAPVEGQFTGFGMGYRTLSAYLTIGMLFSAHHFGSSSLKKTKGLYAGFMLLFFWHLTLLMSRTGYYTFIILAPVMLHFAFRKMGALKKLAICLVVVCAMFLSPVVRERVALTKQQLEYHLTVDQSQAWGKVYTRHQNRFYMWCGAAKIVRDNPLVGVGTGGYALALKEMGNPEWPVIRHPHNDILYMVVSFGIFGLVCVTCGFLLK